MNRQRCLFKHCRRFVRSGEAYCLPPRLCLVLQEQRNAISDGMRQALSKFVEARKEVA